MLLNKQIHVVISCLLFFEGNKVILKLLIRRKVQLKLLRACLFYLIRIIAHYSTFIQRGRRHKILIVLDF